MLIYIYCATEMQGEFVVLECLDTFVGSGCVTSHRYEVGVLRSEDGENQPCMEGLKMSDWTVQMIIHLIFLPKAYSMRKPRDTKNEPHTTRNHVHHSPLT